MTRRAALLAALLLLLPQGARAQAPPPVAETGAIPLTEKRRLGAPRELHLEAFLYRPALTGSRPVLVLERYDCERAVLAAGVERAVEDLDAALAFVAARPWADPTRLLLGGMSRGGLLAVLYPSRRAVAARGVVNFAGGWTVERCDGRTRFNEDTFAEGGPDCPAADALAVLRE